jgi:hypothetical protein
VGRNVLISVCSFIVLRLAGLLVHGYLKNLFLRQLRAQPFFGTFSIPKEKPLKNARFSRGLFGGAGGI